MNNLIDKIAIIGGLLLIMVVAIFLIFSIIEIRTRLKEYKIVSQEYKILKDKAYYEIDVDEGILTILENMISDNFKEYAILNLEYERGYINNETENKITEEVTFMVMSRMSPVLYKKLSAYYNENLITDIITRRVYMVTLEYVLKNNAPR